MYLKVCTVESICKDTGYKWQIERNEFRLKASANQLYCIDYYDVWIISSVFNAV